MTKKICIALITIVFLMTIWLIYARFHIWNIVNNSYDTLTAEEKKNSTAIFCKLMTLAMCALMAYMAALWSIIKTRPLLIIGICTFFLFEIIYWLYLVVNGLVYAASFSTTGLRGGMLLVNIVIVICLVKITRQINHPFLDLKLTRKYDPNFQERRNLHLYIILGLLLLGLPRLYMLIKPIYSENTEFWFSHFTYIAILITYLIGVILKNRFIYLAFATMLVFTISEFNNFIFEVVFTSINLQYHFGKVLDSFWVLPIFRHFSHLTLSILTVFAISKVVSLYKSQKIKNDTVLDT